ncbi:pheromone precursor [Lentinula aciculospora]|uniref:Pheromone n=1 Tax=Lentinula aciculospora TaxID=153920 RepID=A0A9W9DY43_9AGAR|nr:pheromone precursor [Lentinula aciculospora]
MDSFTSIELLSLAPLQPMEPNFCSPPTGDAFPSEPQQSTSSIPVCSEAIGAGDATAFCVIS